MTHDSQKEQFQALTEYVNQTFKGNKIMFGGPDLADGVTVFGFNIGDAALGLLIQPVPLPADGETSEGSTRLMQEAQRDDQVVLVFPHPFDAISGLLGGLQGALNSYVQEYGDDPEAVAKWEDKAIADIHRQNVVMKRYLRYLVRVFGGEEQYSALKVSQAAVACGLIGINPPPDHEPEVVKAQGRIHGWKLIADLERQAGEWNAARQIPNELEEERAYDRDYTQLRALIQSLREDDPARAHWAAHLWLDSGGGAGLSERFKKTVREIIRGEGIHQ